MIVDIPFIWKLIVVVNVNFYKKVRCPFLIFTFDKGSQVFTNDYNLLPQDFCKTQVNEKVLPKETLIRQTKYLNNILEQDRRFIKKITKPILGFKTFLTAEQTLKGIEAMHMIRKEQAENNSSVLTAVEWLNNIFGLAA